MTPARPTDRGPADRGAADKALNTAMVIDDHPLFCDALSMTLRAVLEVQTVKTAECLKGALERLAEGLSPDIIFLDLNLPDVNGLDGLLRLINAAPSVPVIVVSSMSEPRIIASAIRAGARGFIPKHSQRSVFREAFDAISAGEVFVPEGLYMPDESAAPENEQEAAMARLSSLTNQQARILNLICEGKLNKQIAYDLSIAETTVKAHVTAIMRKLRVQSRTQAVLIAQEARFSSIAQGEGGGY
ncbi:response regulator transcription factor [Litorivita sp. NS0012-18]